MKKILLALCVVVSTTISAFAEEIIERKFDVNSFSALSVSSFFDVTLKKGPASVKLTCSPEVFEYVSVRVENGSLIFELLKHPKEIEKSLNKVGLKAEVSTPELLSISLSGASKLTYAEQVGGSDKPLELNLAGGCWLNNQFLRAKAVKANISGASVLKLKGIAENMKLDASGASSLDFDVKMTNGFKAELSGATKGTVDIDCQATEIELSGACQLTVNGKAKAARLLGSGAVTIDGRDFEVDEVQVSLSGASRAKIHPLKALRASLSGGSHCYYRQTTDLLVQEKSVTGGSSIHLL